MLLNSKKAYLGIIMKEEFCMFYANNNWYCQSNENPNYLVTGIGETKEQAKQEWKKEKKELEKHRQ
jgi:hypothetical protein